MAMSKTLICIPCMDKVDTLFMQSLFSLRMVGEVRFSVAASSLIYDSRNLLATQAVEGGYDYTLWFDSDMVFQPDTMQKLIKHLDNGLDFVSGIYFTRKQPCIPVIYDRVGFFKDEKENKLTPTARPFLSYPRDRIFSAEGVGFGCCMVSVKLLKRVREKYGLPFSPSYGFGEDLSFCGRVTELGTKIWVDPSVKCGHIAQVVIDEAAYDEKRTGIRPEKG